MFKNPADYQRYWCWDLEREENCLPLPNSPHTVPVCTVHQEPSSLINFSSSSMFYQSCRLKCRGQSSSLGKSAWGAMKTECEICPLHTGHSLRVLVPQIPFSEQYILLTFTDKDSKLVAIAGTPTHSRMPPLRSFPDFPLSGHQLCSPEQGLSLSCASWTYMTSVLRGCQLPRPKSLSQRWSGTSHRSLSVFMLKRSPQLRKSWGLCFILKPAI